LRLKLLQDLSTGARSPDSAELLAQVARKLLAEAFNADQYNTALEAHSRLMELTRVQGDRAAVARLASQAKALEAARLACEAAQAARQKLQTNPSDAAAGETLGKWDEGLPYLILADDLKLRVIATIDLEPDRSPQQTLSLADQYWEMAEQLKQPQARGLHLRAAFHYHSAALLLEDGLEKIKAQRRIDEAIAIYGKDDLERVNGQALGEPVASRD
jgi:hypothetical protein